MGNESDAAAASEPDKSSRDYWLDYVNEIIGLADSALASKHVSGEDAKWLAHFREDLRSSADQLTKLAERFHPLAADHFFSNLWRVIAAAEQIGARSLVTDATQSYFNTKEKQRLGRSSRRTAKQRAAAWHATLLPIAQELDGRKAPLGLSDMATSVLHLADERGIDVPVGHDSVRRWLRNLEKGGQLKSRSTPTGAS